MDAHTGEDYSKHGAGPAFAQANYGIDAKRAAAGCRRPVPRPSRLPDGALTGALAMLLSASSDSRTCLLVLDFDKEGRKEAADAVLSYFHVRIQIHHIDD